MMTRSVTLTVDLPADLADQAELVAQEDPELLARLVSYGLMRRIVYGHLRARSPDEVPAPASFPGAGVGDLLLFAEARRG